MLKGTFDLAAATAETVTLAKPVSVLHLFNDGSAKVYVVLNWKTGDTEVSATVFHLVVPATGNVMINLGTHIPVLIDNLRCLSSATASVGYLAA